MSKRIWITAASFVVAVLAAGVVVHSYDAARSNTAKELFSQKLRCKQLADEYTRKESDDTASVFLKAVDYSPDSATCIASFSTWEHVSNTYTVRRWEVVNLLTADEVYRDCCR